MQYMLYSCDFSCLWSIIQCRPDAILRSERRRSEAQRVRDYSSCDIDSSWTCKGEKLDDVDLIRLLLAEVMGN